MLTADQLRSVLNYDPATGVFTWIADTGKKRLAGKVAGSASGPEGRTTIRVHRKLYSASRLAWLFAHGEWPVEHIDHANGDPTDNRLVNLREATRSQNMANKKRAKHNSSGIKGVYFDRQSGKWRASFRKNGRNHHVGLYDDKEEAGRAYFAAASNAFGDFATMRA